MCRCSQLIIEYFFFVLLLVFTEPLVNRFATRRKSVFAETYDPENDPDEDEGAAAIFPKSDEQRARLIDAVKNILLFRSLDKEQVNNKKRKKILNSLFLLRKYCACT